jgi:hypothetical protein
MKSLLHNAQRTAQIAVFILSAQTKQLFQVQHSLSLVWRVLYVSILMLYAFGLGMLFHYTDRLNTTPEKLLAGINLALGILTLTKSYFPMYQPTGQPIAAFYPLSRWHKAVLGILLDVASLYTASILVFYGIVFSAAFPLLTPVQMLLSLGMFVSVIILDRSLRLVVEHRIKSRIVLGLGILGLLAVLLGQRVLPTFQHFSPDLLIPSVAFIALLTHCALAWHVLDPRIESGVSSSSHKNSIVTRSRSATFYALKAFFTTKHILQMLGMALLLKLGMVFFLMKADLSNFQAQQSRFHIHFLWIYAAPVAWFTYVLNNSFGMNWQLWQTTQMHNHAPQIMFRLYLRNVIIVLSGDIVLSSVALFVRGLLVPALIIPSACAAVTFVVIGYAVALRYAVKVEQLTSSVFMSLRHVSSTQGMVSVAVVLILIGILVSFHVWLPLIVPVMVIGVFSVFYSRSSSTLKYHLYHGIHK